MLRGMDCAGANSPDGVFFSGQCVSNVVLRVLCCTTLQEECQNFMDRFVEKKQIQYVYQKGGFKIESHNDQFVTQD